MKRVLITGANSYIGDSIKKYLSHEPHSFEVSIMDTVGWDQQECDFSNYDVVLNVAGIAHIKETEKNRHLYYDVNRDLVVNLAKKAKADGVKQFIFFSTMSVYGITIGHIEKNTPVNPQNAYGKSKAEADEEIRILGDSGFKTCCLRPPMVYGKGCKGNYNSLRSFALRTPFFPDCPNQRSMIYIDNLCEFVKDCIVKEKSGLYFPQNAEYVNTSDMVRKIAKCHGKRIRFTKLFNPALKIASTNKIKKVFGSLTYEKVDLVNKFDFDESIKLTEEK